MKKTRKDVIIESLEKVGDMSRAIAALNAMAKADRDSKLNSTILNDRPPSVLLQVSFIWGDTIQGNRYWHNVSSVLARAEAGVADSMTTRKDAIVAVLKDIGEEKHKVTIQMLEQVATEQQQMGNFDCLNTEYPFDSLEMKIFDAPSLLTDNFQWAGTVLGFDFWQAIYHQLVDYKCRYSVTAERTES